MPDVTPFEEQTERYEGWFEAHEDAYRSELNALERLVPASGYGIAIGVGSGRFAAPLGVQVGIDPSAAMLAYARERGVVVVRGVAESLPFDDHTFDTALIVTTICFVDDVPRTLAEAERVLEPGGSLVIGYVDEASPLGEFYRETKDENPFYRAATFVSTGELVEALEAAGFHEFEFVQTLYRKPDEMEGPDPVEEGHGEGSFVGIEATR